MIWKGYGRKQSWPNLRHSSGISFHFISFHLFVHPLCPTNGIGHVKKKYTCNYITVSTLQQHTPILQMNVHIFLGVHFLHFLGVTEENHEKLRIASLWAEI
jgi:hypothetical protein